MDDSFRQVMGFVFMGLAALSAVFHIVRAAGVRLPFEPFRKLPAMQHAWGERAGLAVHVIGYVVVPLVVGFSMWRSTW
ncbi:MAG: hypothetical protein SFX73_10625 [Kofleriaceae bacterium]|nr:hypothetical protein [Kofleriaceae bacterium]